MLHSDKASSSFFDVLRKRHEYAMDAPEQRYQRRLTTGREIGASIVYWPTMNFEKGLLYREPLRDADGGLIRSANGEIQTYAPRDNALAVAYRLGTNVLFKQYLAQYGRAFSVAYNQNRDFRHTVEVGNDLLALSQSAQHLDKAPVSLKQEIRAAMQSPLHGMMTHSIAANRLLTGFASGEMETTPENIAGLTRELDALSQLAQEKAGAMRGMMAMRAYASHTPEAMPQDLKEFSRPSGFIRDVLKQDKLTSMRQSEILLAFTAGLLAEGAIPLSQEELFIPQDHIYITGQQAVDLGRYISDTMRKSGFALNQDAKGKPLVADVPAGAILKARPSANGDTGYVPLSEQELAQFATSLLGYVKQHFAPTMDRLLAYADAHYEDVQNALLGNPAELRNYHDELKTALADSLPAATKAANANSAAYLSEPWQSRVQPKNLLEKAASLPSEAYRHLNLMENHLSRPEATHEIKKLFSRSLPAYILNLPISMVSHILLGFTKRDANWHHIPVTRENWKKHGAGLILTPENMKASLFQLMVYPVVESLGSVEMVELANYPRTLALDAAKHMDDVLLAAVKTAGQDEALRSGIEQIARKNPAAEVLAEHPEYRKVMQALEGKPVLNSAEDYELLARFYHDVSARVAKDAAAVFTPFMHKGESFKDALHHVTHAPVGTVGEAALALSFLRSITALNQRNIRWLEFLPPEEAHMGYKELGTLARFMNEQAVNAGLTVFNPKTMHGQGMQPGELVHRDAATGVVRHASAEEIIRLANVGTQKFREIMIAHDMESVTTGKYSDRYIAETEKLLFAPARFAAASTQTQQPQVPQAGTPHASQAWDTAHVKLPGNGHSIMEAAKFAVRPEASHQMNKLFWRVLFTRILYTPVNISENLMWRHKIKIDTKAPITTQVKQFFNSNNVRQSMWTLVSFPIAFSYGVTTMWEFGSFLFGKQREAKKESKASVDYLSAAISAGGQASANAVEEMARLEGGNPTLIALQEKEEFKRLPEIFAKPQEARSQQERELTERFFTQAGDAMMQHAGWMLSGESAVPKDMVKHLEELITRPAKNISEATRKLAFAETIIEMNTKYVDMMRYFDPEERLIDTKRLAQLGTYIHKQAIGAGFMLSKPDDAHGHKPGMLLERTADGQYRPARAENLIRFANVVGDKVAQLVNVKNLDKALHGRLSDHYLEATDRNTSSLL